MRINIGDLICSNKGYGTHLSMCDIHLIIIINSVIKEMTMHFKQLTFCIMLSLLTGHVYIFSLNSIGKFI